MPTCAKCETRFPNWVVVEGKRRNISSRKYCLDCSPFGRHNTRKLEQGWECVCQICGKSYTFGHRKGCSRLTCGTCLVQRRRTKLQTMAVEYAGGSCLQCGYSGCVPAMDFHHLDPSTKEFGISQACARTRSWEVIRKEIDKCILLCCRCHREVEAGLITPEEVRALLM